MILEFSAKNDVQKTEKRVDSLQRKKGHRDICIGENEEEIVSKGYLKIPGDECDESQLSEAEKRETNFIFAQNF